MANTFFTSIKRKLVTTAAGYELDVCTGGHPSQNGLISPRQRLFLTEPMPPPTLCPTSLSPALI